MGILDFLIGVPSRKGGSTPRTEPEDTCPECGGEGEVTVASENGTEERETCPLCQGSGRARA